MITGVIVACLILSILLSALEAATFAVSRARVRHRADEPSLTTRKRRSMLLHKLLTPPERLITAIILSNNATNMLLLVLIATYLSGHLGDAGYVWAFFIGLPLYLSIELIPKSIAQHSPYRLLRLCTPILEVLYYLPGLLFTGFDRVTNRPFRPETAAYEREEFVNLTNVMKQEHTLSNQACQTIHRILKLRSVTAEGLMAPISEVRSVEPTAPAATALEIVKDSNREALPVRNESGEFARWVTLKDLAQSAPNDTVAKLAERAAIFEATTPAPSLLKFLRAAGAPLGLVRNETTAIVGIVYLEDVIESLLAPATRE